jgi:PAS domain S-box-containing protein
MLSGEMSETKKDKREHSMARLFDMARIFFLLIIIPLSLFIILIYTGIFEVGETTRKHATAVLDEEYQNKIRIRTVHTAYEVAKFLEERKNDLLIASIIPQTGPNYEDFVRRTKSYIWTRANGKFIRSMAPIYREMSLIDRNGMETVKIEGGRIVKRVDLKVVSDPANTTYKSEDYFARTATLEKGKIYISPITGWYVNKKAFEEGKTFEGILRMATPLYEDGEFSGIITLAIDARHLAEFTDHIIPTEPGYVAHVDASVGNYAYIVDNRGFVISHPFDYHIAGLYRDGSPVPPLTEDRAGDLIGLGEEVLNLNLLGFMDSGMPEIARRASEGKSGVMTYKFGGHTKFVAYAPIKFYGEGYPEPSGFGWVGMGVDVDKLSSLMTTTFQDVRREVESWIETVIIILVASVILLLLISALLARGISRQYKVIAKERARHVETMKMEFKERERTLLQIVQGSTIPTFVINKEHIVTHWNISLERLTGLKASDLIGTKKHWMAFYDGEKPVMADLIINDVKDDEIKKYYGDNGRKSPFIEGAYEAESFFPHIGEGGRWLYFTAAPIKGPEGEIIGAIETLWDRTDSKLLDAERERHLRQLSILWDITTALSATMDPDERIRAAGREIFDNFDIDSMAVYIRDKQNRFQTTYAFGYQDSMYQKGSDVGPDYVIKEVADKNEIIFFENVTIENTPYEAFVSKEGLKSAAYLPLASKAIVFGVARISSHTSERFSEEDKNLLAIIANHIALEIENARLHYEAKSFGQSLEVKVKEKTKKLEESYDELRLSEEKYRTMFDSDPNPIIIADRKTLQIVDVNATAVECYGYTREEFLKKSFIDLQYQEDKDVLAALDQLIMPNQSLTCPKKLHKKRDGTSFFVDINISSVKFMGKDCLIVNTPNITEHVEKETQLIQASKMATLGTMASGIAHEISQPLNVMQVCSDFIIKTIKKGDTIGEADLNSVAEEIEKNVQRAALTIKHMKDFVRKSEVSGDRLNVNNPILDVFKLLGQQLRVHGIRVELDLADGLPPILGDHNRLEQVFVNLVTNARDALDEREPMQSVSDWQKVLRIESFSDNGRVVVKVIDNGTGIPEEIRDKVFEPFFTTKEVGKGTGLGITISYGIIKDYDGTIDVESVVDSGTTFTLTFPAVR